jgi:hypothetical protein
MAGDAGWAVCEKDKLLMEGYTLYGVRVSGFCRGKKVHAG